MKRATKLFGTDGIRDTANRGVLTPGSVVRIGQVIGRLLRETPQGFTEPLARRLAGLHHRAALGKVAPRTVVVGRDPRESGPMIEAALVAGLLAENARVRLAGVCPTPVLAHLTRKWDAACGLMISASHNPAEDNGIKVFSCEGLKAPDAVEEAIERLHAAGAHAGDAAPTGTRPLGRVEDNHDRVSEYAEYILTQVALGLSLKGMRLVLDCANGATYQVAPRIFAQLGAQVVAIHVTPDGRNINRHCGALYANRLRRAVLQARADGAVCFDGDGDRVLLLDEKGHVLDGDYVLAVAGKWMKAHGALLHDTVVGTVMANQGLEVALREEGIRLLRTPVGDRHVAQRMLEGGFVLGGEQSGHVIFLADTTTGDGIVTALRFLRICRELDIPLSHAAKSLVKYPQVLVNVRVRRKPPFDGIPAVAEAQRRARAILGDQGRILLRYSGTESIARVMAEGPRIGDVRRAVETLAGAVRNQLA
jgi:phosphoglucosamine mutase